MNSIMKTTSLAALSAVDYGYEDHIPGPKSNSDDAYERSVVAFAAHHHHHHQYHEFPSYNRRGSIGSPFTEEDDEFDYDIDNDTAERNGTDATEVSQSPSHNGCSTVTFDLFKEANDYPPMPADRQARKQRSFVRRGGAVHATLLKSAVMASMMDFDSGTDDEMSGGPRRNADLRRDSSISLQSLQDALHTETSPRKRARRRVRTNASEDTEDDDDDENTPNNNNNNNNNTATAGTIHSDADTQMDNNSNTSHDFDVNEASHLFDTMRMGNGNHTTSNIMRSVAAPPVRKDSFKREPPPRRVSRKTSYDSRVSDFESDCGSDWED